MRCRSHARTTLVSTLTVIAALFWAAGCTTADPSNQPAPETTRAHVGWMNTMCTQIQSLEEVKRAPTMDASGTPSFGVDSDFTASSYLTSTQSTVDSLVRALSTLPPLSSPATRRLTDDYLRQLNGIKPELEQLGEANRTRFDQPADQARQASTRMSELVNSVATPRPDLATVASADSVLARAYDLAPGCDPRTRQQVAAPPASPTAAPAGAKLLPRPANGTDMAACAAGTCEVLVEKPTDITVAGTVFSVDTDVNPVVVSTQYPGGGGGQLSLGVGGSGSFGSARTGQTVTIVVEGVADGAAVVKFSTT